MGMQALIMAAGRGTRTSPLNYSVAKPCLPILGKSILQRTVDEIETLVDEFIVVIDKKDHFTKKTLHTKNALLRFVYTTQPLGTAHALQSALPFLQEKFLVLMGDDVYSYEDIKRICEYNLAALVEEVDDVTSFGAVKVKKGNVIDIVEKPATQISNLASTGAFVLDRRIVPFLKKIKKKGDEYYLSDAVHLLIKKEQMKVVKVKKLWFSIRYWWSVLEANLLLLKEQKRDIRGVVEKGAVIRGTVIVEQGAIIKKGAYVQGPARIGPYCIIKGTLKNVVLGSHCVVESGAKVTDSLLLRKVKVGKNSVVEHSVLGDEVRLAARTIVLSQEKDRKIIQSRVKRKNVSTERKHLGALFAEKAKTKTGTVVMPGTIFYPSVTSLKNEWVHKDKF